MKPAKTSTSHPIRVDWVTSDVLPEKRLGITFAPGKKDPYGQSGVWDRDLATDLADLRRTYEVDTLICLLEDSELTLLRIPDLPERAQAEALNFIRFPIRDATAPDYSAELQRLVKLALSEVAEGRRVVVHCRGGLGRAGTFAAYCLVSLGVPATQAIELVRKARHGAVETPEQVRSILEFAHPG